MKPEQFVEEYEKALSSQQWENVAPLVHPDCTVTFSSGTHKGVTAVEKAFRRNFESIKNESYAMKDLYWVHKTDALAVYTFTFHWSGLIHGKAASGSGRGTSCLVRNGGSWLLVTEHLGPPEQ